MKKPLRKGYKVERLTDGKWLWVIMPPFKTRADAEGFIKQTAERDSKPAEYRVVEE